MSSSSPCPYTHGSEVALVLPSAAVIKAKVLDIKTMTMSCVMTVQLPSCSGIYILKLYDRRFAEQLRKDEEAAPWDIQIEHRYHDFIRTGDPSAFFDRWSTGLLDDQYYDDEQRGEWSQEVLETYLQFLCQKAYDAEKHAYNLMHDLQGIHIPELYHSVVLTPSTNLTIDEDATARYLNCPGLIVQHIDGFPLTDLATRLHSQEWQQICERAISIVHQAGDRGVCNKDVKTRSFIICQIRSHLPPGIFMIDFGSCLFRDQARDEGEFREWQADQDEEGAIGCVMERLLGGEYQYCRSERAKQLLYEFKREQ